ncbi:MAG: M20 family peptidase [Balneolaceae bacterium]
MFKKILLVLLGVVLTLVTIFLVNTFRLDHTQIEPGTLTQVNWDRNSMIDRFSRSIQYRTISGDDGDMRDTTEFYSFLDFIEEQYPLTHTRLAVRVFNDLTPVYHWAGSDPSLDPILLMGHYDVVPIDSTDIDGWGYSPFSGEVADGYIWGRGTMDNKFNVMALLETIEYLLTNDFQPKRGIYLSFGHDEEIGGSDGARAVSRYFQDENIRLEYVLDEGGAVLDGSDLVDKRTAMIGIAEKGYLSLELIARTQGGHSSAPPTEMAITKLSEAIGKLIGNQFPATLEGSTEEMFDAIASKLPFGIRVVYANRWATEGFMLKMMSSDPEVAPMVRTTIAPTILRAGVKDNVLPNEARAVVNFRILPGDTFETVKEHVERVITDDDITVREYGPIMVPPSRVSPINSSSYMMIQQTIMDRFQDLYVLPYLVSGATDSRHFSNVTDHIYRFAPIEMGIEDMRIMHGTNERIRIDAYTGAIDFYVHLIRRSTE